MHLSDVRRQQQLLELKSENEAQICKIGNIYTIAQNLKNRIDENPFKSFAEFHSKFSIC